MIKVGFVGDPHLTATSPRSRKDDYMVSILNKMAQIIYENDVIVFLGDIFHTPQVGNVATNLVMMQFLQALREGKRVIGCVGNHDLHNMNMDKAFFNKTSLSILVNSGAINISDSHEVEGLVIDVLPLVNRPKRLEIKANIPGSILIGHYFFESPLDPTFSLTREMLTECGYTYVILGHDHDEFEPLVLGSTTLIRPGAISRNTSHETNLTRTPKYVQLTVSDGKIKGVRLKPLECLSVEDAFHEGVLNKREEGSGNLTFMANIENLLASFRQTVNSHGLSVKDALIKGKSPEMCMEYLKSVHERMAMPF